jgi:acyl-lipid omega-6 desaturase (Delta-12 desaturase)
MHHASSGDLDRRGHGDVPTLTVKEYLGRSRWGRLHYRIVRHPLLLLLGGPFYLFLSQRVRPKGAATHDKQVSSVLATNLAIILTVTIFSLLIGFGTFLKIYLPVFYIAAMAGVWLFYVQHQFDGAYWEPHEEWDYATAAVVGSSYFKLPRVLRWFTGNIGLHHVHHLGPRIPNYRLQRCHDDNALFHRATVVTLTQSLSALRLSLWDEEQRRLVRFRDVAVDTGAAG